MRCRNVDFNSSLYCVNHFEQKQRTVSFKSVTETANTEAETLHECIESCVDLGIDGMDRDIKMLVVPRLTYTL